MQESVWELYYSLSIRLNLFWLRGSACFEYDKTVINLPPISADEIRQIIVSLKCKTTSNFYDMPAKFLKISASGLSSWLSEFFNKCMVKGDYPNLLKIAQITPIPKITSPKSPNDHRPISILPTLFKVFEKVSYSRLCSFVTSNCILSQQQYGFRTNHSTELPIAAIYDDLIFNEDNKLITCTLFLDLNKSLWVCWS